MIAFRGQKEVGPRPDWSPLEVKFKFPKSIPTPFICGVPPTPKAMVPTIPFGKLQKIRAVI